MFKIISRKKYKELVGVQKAAEDLKGRLNAMYGKCNANVSACVRERNLLAEEFRKAEDCIDDVYTLLNAISDKCNINALKAAKSRIGTYYTDPKIHCATNLAAQCMQVKMEDGEDEDTVTVSCQVDAPNDAVYADDSDRPIAICHDPEEKEENK